MEKGALEFPNIERVLKEYAESAGDTFRSYMSQLGKDASGALSKSARAEVRMNDRGFEVVMHLEEYWKWVEQGRRPNGKFPPPDKIREWIEIKPVLPKPMKNGRLPTTEQLAYLIGRKIAIKGIAPTPVLQSTVTSLNERFIGQLKEAILQDCAYLVKVEFRN